MLLEQLRLPDEEQAVLAQLESTRRTAHYCPHCSNKHVVKNGQADGSQRYKCRRCSKSFNVLTGTPLARLGQRHKWHAQTRVIDDGLSVQRAAERLHVARSTAFRWRHRFLDAIHQLRPSQLSGIAEAGETFILRSQKGQSVSGRLSRQRGASLESVVPVMITCRSLLHETERDGAQVISCTVVANKDWFPLSPPFSPVMPCYVPVEVQRWPLQQRKWMQSITSLI